MTNVRFSRGDRGAAATGYLVVLGVLALIALAAWWGLSALGFMGDASGEEGDNDGTGDAVVGEPMPAWLEGTGQSLPPVIVIDEREPEVRIMADWVWDYVDDEWSVEVFRSGSGDGGGSLTDHQVVLLVSPDEYRFRLFETRIDYLLEVLLWSPSDRLAWVARTGRGTTTPVVELDLATGVSREDWLGTAAPSVNTQGLGVFNVAPVGVLADGREAWVAYDDVGALTGLMWRTPGGDMRRSLMTDEVRRQRIQGFTRSEGMEAWIDIEGQRAVYHGVFAVDGAVRDQVWILHDLATDEYRVVDPLVPSGALCEPHLPLLSTEHFDGDRIVAWCRAGSEGSVALIDPTGAQPPS